jgi:hypothetical protein
MVTVLLTLFVFAVLTQAGHAATGSPAALLPAKPGPSWRSLLDAVGRTPKSFASVQNQSPTGGDILIVNDGGGEGHSPEPAENLQAMLEHDGYSTTLKSKLPADLAPYEAIWYIDAFNAISSSAQASLEGFVRSGKGLYLTGERPCCEPLNHSDETILGKLLDRPPIRVGDDEDVERPSFTQNLVNPSAVGGIAQIPNRLSTWQPSAPGAIIGVPEQNTFTFGYQPVFPVATGAAWSSSEIVGGHGALVLMMDIDWLEAAYGNLPQAEQFVVNIQRFLTGRPANVSRYVALGDSFSSGDGNPPYEPESVTQGCKRSAANAYPDVIAKDLGLSASQAGFDFAACSGAKVDEIQADQLSGLGNATRLVTMTAGGDTVGFAPVLKACILYHYRHLLSDTSCASNASAPPDVRNAKTNIQALLGSLEALDREVRSRAPGAASHIYVLGYPDLFPLPSKVTNGCSGLNKASVLWLSERQTELNNVVSAAARAERLNYVNPNEPGKPYSFEGHDICSAHPWFHTVVSALAGSTPLHPNQEGQHRLAEALADAGATKVNINAVVNSDGGALPASLHGEDTHSQRLAPSRAAREPGGALPAVSGTGTITGKVTAPGGEALSGATVYAQSPELGFYESAQTEAKGKYTIANVGAGTYKVEFLDTQQYETQWYQDKSSEATATPIVVKSGGSARNINATLAPYGSISGTVTSNKGVALSNVRVTVTNVEGGTLATGETTLDGSYTISGLSAGSYKMQFAPAYFDGEYFETQWYKGQPSLQAATVVTLSGSQNTININAELNPDATVSGTVTAAGGHPLEDVEVIVESEDGGSQIAFTGASGTYTVYGVPAGSHTVEFIANGQLYADQWYDGKSRAGEASTLNVTSGENASNINAVLAPDASVSGTVTAANGRPLSGVMVEAVGVEGGASVSALTAADGSFSIPGLAAGQYTVRFNGNGKYFAEQWYDHAATEAAALILMLAPGEERQNINGEMTPTAATIEGQVNDSNGPVAGVQVLASAGSGPAAGTAVTAADGSYVIEGLTAGSYTVEFEAEAVGDINQFYEDAKTQVEAAPVVLATDATASAINATLQRGATITGTVTAPGGTPLAGVQVDIKDEAGSFVAATASSEEGTYSVSGLPAGSYKVQFEPGEGNYVGQYYDNAASAEAAEPITLAVGAIKENVDAQLKPGGSIAGTVTAAPGGEPVAGVQAYVTNAEGTTVASAVSDAEGGYTVPALPAGSYTVRFEPDEGNYIGQYYNDAAGAEAATKVVVVAGAITEDVNAALSAGASIAGTVTSPGDEPASGVQVYVTSSDGTTAASATTNEDGTYSIVGLPAGSYTVQFEPPNSTDVGQFYNAAATAEAAEPVVLSAGAVKENINAELAAAGSVTGTVTAAGGGIGGVRVNVTSTQSAAVGSATTAADGAYTVTGLPAGSYTVQFESPDANYVNQYYEAASSTEDATTVTVSAGAASENINAELAGGASITGKVTAAQIGEPLSGIQVSVSSGEGDAAGTATTGEDGSYAISGLPAGQYTVHFEPSGANYVEQYFANATTPEAAQPVALTAGATNEGIDAALTVGASISGSVTDSKTGDPVNGIEVEAYTASCAIANGVASSDVEGDYKIEGLAAGTYRLVFNPAGGSYQVKTYAGTITLAKEASRAGINESLIALPQEEWAPPVACEETPTAEPPEFGRCLKAVKGEFKTSLCDTGKLGTASGKYEWTPGVTETKLSGSAAAAKFETTAKTKIACKAATASGEYSGAKSLMGVVIRFTGCTGFASTCASSGGTSGEIVTRSLGGALGWQEQGKKKVALDLSAVGSPGSLVANFACGMTAVSWRGSVIAPATADKMSSSSSYAFSAAHGKQKPEHLENASPDVLEQSVDGGPYVQLGATFKLVLSGEEPVEANTAR